MTLINFFQKGKLRAFYIFSFVIFQYPRILKYKLLSSCSCDIEGKPRVWQPVIYQGLGSISFGTNVNLGVQRSPSFYSNYIYMDVRKKESKIVLGSNVWMNNNCCIVSEGEGVFIGDDCLIGENCVFYDSDFHDLNPRLRMGGSIKTGKVVIEHNVFIGSSVTVLKGVRIGENTVIANGSVVTKSLPGNVIAGGVPAKVIRRLGYDFN